MVVRRLQLKMVLGSTLEEIEKTSLDWLDSEKLCPGNLIDFKLENHRGVYQLVIWYAKVVENKNGKKRK